MHPRSANGRKMNNDAPKPLHELVEQFLSERTEAAPGAIFTSTADLVAAAQQWVGERGEFLFSARALARALRGRGAQRHSTGAQRGWRGVRLR